MRLQRRCHLNHKRGRTVHAAKTSFSFVASARSFSDSAAASSEAKGPPPPARLEEEPKLSRSFGEEGCEEEAESRRFGEPGGDEKPSAVLAAAPLSTRRCSSRS